MTAAAPTVVRPGRTTAQHPEDDMIQSFELHQLIARERTREIERTVRHGRRRRKPTAAAHTARHVNDR